MKYVSKLRVRLELEHLRGMANVQIDPSFKMGEGSVLSVKQGIRRLRIGPGVVSRRFLNVLMYPNATCIIGQNVFFNNYCSINCLEHVEIGSDTMFGESVKIYDHNHLYKIDTTVSINREEFKKDPVKIGNNCWIGSNVIILMGVTIGDNVVIGANCLIHKSVPSNSIVKHREVLVTSTAGYLPAEK